MQGLFPCTEAVFQSLKGVINVVSGYMGGYTRNPTYTEVCNGDTGHAEVVQVTFDPTLISFNELLLVFFKTHNPTTLNAQGNDIGEQYRSVIFYHNDSQKQQAEQMINTLEKEQVFDKPIVTQVTPASEFYPAEDYHHNYFNLNSDKPYCALVIQPKLAKFTQEFKDKLKSEIL